MNAFDSTMEVFPSKWGEWKVMRLFLIHFVTYSSRTRCSKDEGAIQDFEVRTGSIHASKNQV